MSQAVYSTKKVDNTEFLCSP